MTVWQIVGLIILVVIALWLLGVLR